mgnify:CR=1 FL=1
MYLLQIEYLRLSQIELRWVDQQVVSHPFYDTRCIEFNTSFSNAISSPAMRSLSFGTLSPTNQLTACEIPLDMILTGQLSPLNASRTNNINCWPDPLLHGGVINDWYFYENAELRQLWELKGEAQLAVMKLPDEW